MKHGGKRHGDRDITRLLRAHRSGSADAFDKLLPIVYDELHRMAGKRLRGERSNHTLDTTALVHEAYLKLIQFEDLDWQNRTHFFAIASRVMRNILVDHAVKRKAQKRGGGKNKVPLRESDAVVYVDMEDILAIHQALNHLGSVDERQVRVVECRFFGGMTIKETAEALDVSPATVGRDWQMARAWLNRELTG